MLFTEIELVSAVGMFMHVNSETCFFVCTRAYYTKVLFHLLANFHDKNLIFTYLLHLFFGTIFIMLPT